jgi:hypothetical protein
MEKFYIIFLIIFCLYSQPSSAKYNDNMQGVLTGVYVYTDGDYIYFTLNNQPTSHPKCKSNYFVIPSTVPQNRREMLLSRLLTAYSMKERVNIGYDNSVECANGYIKVHRVG